MLRKGKNIYKMFTERQKQLIENAVNKAIDQGQRSGSVIIWDVENNGGIAANFTLECEQIHIQACFITKNEFESHMRRL
ncbi:MAG: hypothetical protein K6E76_07945 [Patescibacteria group bacterium]|nr:hypothetical protein [Patescibacteria group bacterium]